MDGNAVTNGTRPGKSSFWNGRAATRDAGDSQVASSQPGPVPGISPLDAVRSVFWLAYRHLFPAHSRVVQMPNGGLVISWSVEDEPEARYRYATPVMLRFDPALVEQVEAADSRQRLRIAQAHEATLREGLRGYDPFARFPNARVIVIG